MHRAAFIVPMCASSRTLAVSQGGFLRCASSAAGFGRWSRPAPQPHAFRQATASIAALQPRPAIRLDCLPCLSLLACACGAGSSAIYRRSEDGPGQNTGAKRTLDEHTVDCPRSTRGCSSLQKGSRTDAGHREPASHLFDESHRSTAEGQATILFRKLTTKGKRRPSLE